MTYSGRIVASCVCALGAIVALGANSALAEDGAPFLPEDVIERVQRSYRHHDGAYEAHVAGLRARYTVADGLFVTSADASIENADQSSGWHVRTVQAVRGVRDLLSTSPEVSARQSAGLSIRHAGLEERLTNSASGVEQSWHFTDAPTGQGVLRVAVEISNGLLPRAADDGGWEVPHPGAGGTLRYGRATWVDGDGVRTPIAATIHGDRIVMEVPADLLESSAYPATLDPTISAEFGMDDPAGTAASHDHWLPGVAFDGTNFLVVWWDRRAGSQVWATRVTPSGEVLDATGIEVSNPGSRPSVTFDGVAFTVAYSNVGNIWTRQVDPLTGAVSAANQVSFTGQAWYLDVEWNGSTNLVIWADTFGSSSYNVRAARVTDTGVTIDTASILVAAESLDAAAMELACDVSTGDCLVVWEQNTASLSWDVHAARVAATGVVLDTTPFTVGNSTAAFQGRPTVAFDGVNYGVAYYDSSLTAVAFARVATNGSVLDPSGIQVSPGGAEPSIAWDGTNYLVAWQDCGGGCPVDVLGARVSTAGVVLDTTPITIASATLQQQEVRVGFGAGVFLAVWRDHRHYPGIGDNVGDAFAVRIDGAGNVLAPDPIDLTPGANNQLDAAVGFDGVNYLVAWEDDRFGDSQPDIFATRVTRTGDILDPAGIAVAAKAGEQENPDIAFDGTNFLVVFEDDEGNRVVRGVRVATDGTVLDPTPILLSGGAVEALDPAVDWNGTNYLVVWSDLRNGGPQSQTDIYGARVTPALLPLDIVGFGIAVEVLSGGLLNSERLPDLASIGSDWLVVWRGTNGADFDIDGRVVLADGSLAGSAKLPISLATFAQSAPAIAASDTQYLVAWEDDRFVQNDVFATRVDAAGAALDPGGIAVSTGGSTLTAPAVTHDGAEFFVAWQDDASGDQHVLGTRVSASGVVDAPGGIVLAGLTEDEIAPALASHGSGTTLVAYHRFDAESPFLSTRIRARLVGDCGNGSTDPAEECDDANSDGGDGCSAICRIEDSFQLYGVAQGGTIDVVIDGVTIQVSSQNGDLPGDLILTLVAAVNGDGTLHALGVTAIADGDRLVTDGAIESVTITDPGLSDIPPPLPVLGSWVALALLTMGLLVVGLWSANEAAGVSRSRG